MPNTDNDAVNWKYTCVIYTSQNDAVSNNNNDAQKVYLFF